MGVRNTVQDGLEEKMSDGTPDGGNDCAAFTVSATAGLNRYKNRCGAAADLRQRKNPGGAAEAESGHQTETGTFDYIAPSVSVSEIRPDSECAAFTVPGAESAAYEPQGAASAAASAEPDPEEVNNGASAHGPGSYADSEDTICAISTPPGRGGIGIIRISGPDAYRLLMSVFRPAKEVPLEDHRLTYGHVVDRKSGGIIDEVLAVYMKAPSTYTAEDSAEIDCHGGRIPLERTLSLLMREGAKPAEPGEFTERAFLNGRIDLTQAEAVMDVISARTDRSLKAAVDQLSGGLSGEIRAVRKMIMDLRVELAVNIDYPDEDIESLTYEKLEKGFTGVSKALTSLSDSAKTGRILREGLRVAILGKPNVGKSSLMNALLRTSRAIVTDIPGTTRDTIEESLDLHGIPVILTDTAGIRDTDDEVEALGVLRSKETVERSDLALLILDGSESLTDEDREIAGALTPENTVIFINKLDLGSAFAISGAEQCLPGAAVICGSVQTGDGIKVLEDCIEKFALRETVTVSAREENGSGESPRNKTADTAAPASGIESSAISSGAGSETGTSYEKIHLAGDAPALSAEAAIPYGRTYLTGFAPAMSSETAVPDGMIGAGFPEQEVRQEITVTNARHRELIRSALEKTEDALELVRSRAPFEVIDLDAEEAYTDLGLIIGEEATDDLLREVFSRFCLGK